MKTTGFGLMFVALVIGRVAQGSGYQREQRRRSRLRRRRSRRQRGRRTGRHDERRGRRSGDHQRHDRREHHRHHDLRRRRHELGFSDRQRRLRHGLPRGPAPLRRGLRWKHPTDRLLRIERLPVLRARARQRHQRLLRQWHLRFHLRCQLREAGQHLRLRRLVLLRRRLRRQRVHLLRRELHRGPARVRRERVHRGLYPGVLSQARSRHLHQRRLPLTAPPRRRSFARQGPFRSCIRRRR